LCSRFWTRRDGGLYTPEDIDRAALFAALAVTALDVEPELLTGLGQARDFEGSR
jgi:hypothetical protein